MLWALGDKKTGRVIERAHERAIALTLGWLEDEVAEVRWGPAGSVRKHRPWGRPVAALRQPRRFSTAS
ncbi:relaxase domain-containing protein [Streptomyces sp. NPDC006368]|uniref:relaxase domain-containing protein n=1 Tax=Streptomyces sp. NPDC006368 TaxID=3156760 RepID=UPI0033A7F357